MVIIDDVESDGEGEEDGKDGNRKEVAIEEEIKDDKDDKLGKNAEDGPSEAISEKAFEETEGVMLAVGGFLMSGFSAGGFSFSGGGFRYCRG